MNAKLADLIRPSTGADDATEDLNAPHARPSNKPEFAFHVIAQAGDRTTFQYAQLDSHAQLRGGCEIVLLFAGSKLWRVTLKGRNLQPLYDNIHRHKLAWVRVIADPMHAAAQSTEASVVEQAIIEEVTEEDD